LCFGAAVVPTSFLQSKADGCSEAVGFRRGGDDRPHEAPAGARGRSHHDVLPRLHPLAGPPREAVAEAAPHDRDCHRRRRGRSRVPVGRAPSRKRPRPASEQGKGGPGATGKWGWSSSRKRLGAKWQPRRRGGTRTPAEKDGRGAGAIGTLLRRVEKPVTKYRRFMQKEGHEVLLGRRKCPKRTTFRNHDRSGGGISALIDVF